MKERREIPDKWFLVPIISLFIHLIYRMIDQSKMIFHFALDYHNDVSSYMAQLHFLKVCGFHQICPYWYNGFETFKFSPPGWYMLNYPLYLILNDVKIVTYISIVLMLIAGFIIFYRLGKLADMSTTKRIAFFALFFGNASAIGNFIRLGRVNEMLSWVFFIALFFIFYYYKDKKIDYKFYVCIPLYALIVLSYHTTGVLSSLLWLGFLLTKKSTKDFLKTIISGILSLGLTSFWLVPFILNIFSESAIPELKQGKWIWYFGKNALFTNIAVLIMPLIFIILFYFYYKGENRNNTNFRLFMPVVVLGALFLLRLTPLLPVFNQIYPDPILHFLVFFGIFFLLKLDINELGSKMKNIAVHSIMILTFLSISVNLFYTPYFSVPDSEIEKEFISYVPLVKERFIMVGSYPEGPFPKAFYSFAGTKNKASISGWYPEEKDYSYIKGMAEVYIAFDEGRMDDFKTKLKEFNTSEVMTRSEFCEKLNIKEFRNVAIGNKTCLYTLE